MTAQTLASTQTSPSGEKQPVRIDSRHLLWAGSLAAIASVLANLLIRAIALGVLNAPPEFPPLNVGPIVGFTILGILAATVVFAIVARRTHHTIAWYRRVALVALVLSFLPDLGLYLQKFMPGTNEVSVGALVAMHIVTALITVALLTSPRWVSTARS